MTDHSSSEPTEPPGPPPERTTEAEDELVSAVLDGEATLDERELVNGDPRLRARLESFTHNRQIVGTKPQIADETREASIAKALAASSLAETVPRDDATTIAVLAVERARRKRQLATIVAAAAIVLIAVPLLAIALTGRGTEENLASTDAAVNESSDQLSREAGDAAASSTTPPPQSEASSRVASGPGFVGDLGAIDTTSQLRAEVESALVDEGLSLGLQSSAPQSTTTAPTQQESFSAGDASLNACAATIASADPSLGFAVLTATARWTGEPAIVLVFRAFVPSPLVGQPDELTDVIVLARPDCSTIGRFVA